MPERKPLLKRKIRPSVPVNLEGGVTLQVSFDLNVLARIEDRTGLKLIGNVFTLWQQMSSAKVLGATFWSACLPSHPEYDSEEGFEILTSFVEGGNVKAVTESLAEAYPLFLSRDQAELFRKLLKAAQDEVASENPPTPAKTETKGVPPAASSSSTGSSSGPSPDSTLESAASASSAS